MLTSSARAGKQQICRQVSLVILLQVSKIIGIVKLLLSEFIFVFVISEHSFYHPKNFNNTFTTLHVNNLSTNP